MFLYHFSLHFTHRSKFNRSTFDCFVASFAQNLNFIPAKVPILRFHHPVNGIEVDLNYNNCVGIRNSHLQYCYSLLDWRLRPLAVTVKRWAQHHGINNAKDCTISSYSLILMVIQFLQCGVQPPILPCLHVKHPEHFDVSVCQCHTHFSGTIE